MSFFQAEDGIRDTSVTGVQTCALPIYDLYFYLYHAALHTKFLYKKIHITHHRSTMPIPMEYIFTHPLEWLFGAIGPFIGLAVIAIFFPEINAYALWAMMALRNLHELDIHSGIRSSKIVSAIPFYGTTEHHDLHHSRNQGNYASTFTIWDKVVVGEMRISGVWGYLGGGFREGGEDIGLKL